MTHSSLHKVLYLWQNFETVADEGYIVHKESQHTQKLFKIHFGAQKGQNENVNFCMNCMRQMWKKRLKVNLMKMKKALIFLFVFTYIH